MRIEGHRSGANHHDSRSIRSHKPLRDGSEVEPSVRARTGPLDELLDDDVFFERVKADLLRRHPNSGRCGRHSTPVEVILRMLVVKRLYSWSYEQTERFVNDSMVLRQFARVYLQSAPDDTTLIRWANVIGSETVLPSTTGSSNSPAP